MKKLIYMGITLISLILILFLIRLVLPTQIDDVSPEIPCEEKLLERADVLYVVPSFNGKPISENEIWCDYILSFDKELALHGFSHEYKEFKELNIDEKLEGGIKIFEECFGYEPERFKPPNLAISAENKKLVREKLELDFFWNQIFHKVYHCNDTGVFPNWVVRVF